MNTTNETDILKIFQEMQEKAQEINPALNDQIKSYSDNKVIIDSYQQFVYDKNSQPMVYTVSNHTL